jgi:subtilisin family serine protease
VSGVVALVRADHPAWTQAQVVARIKATADGTAGPGTGNGMVNPVAATQHSAP